MPGLADLRRERLALLSQIDSRFRAHAARIESWSERMTDLIGAGDVFVAADGDSVTGYVTVQRPPDDATIALIDDIALDAHRYLGGVGRELVRAARANAEQWDCTVVLVRVPRFYPVEQAFWRALGARIDQERRIGISMEDTPEFTWMTL
jgi:GNAT superfamily N-acetyltransferase